MDDEFETTQSTNNNHQQINSMNNGGAQSQNQSASFNLLKPINILFGIDNLKKEEQKFFYSKNGKIFKQLLFWAAALIALSFVPFAGQLMLGVGVTGALYFTGQYVYTRYKFPEQLKKWKKATAQEEAKNQMYENVYSIASDVKNIRNNKLKNHLMQGELNDNDINIHNNNSIGASRGYPNIQTTLDLPDPLIQRQSVVGEMGVITLEGDDLTNAVQIEMNNLGHDSSVHGNGYSKLTRQSRKQRTHSIDSKSSLLNKK